MKIQELEAAFCGIVMRDKAAMADAIAEGVEPKHLQNPLHSKIYAKCVAIWDKGGTTDLVSVGHAVGFEELEAIREIRRQAPMTQNHMAYVAALLDHWRQMELHAGLADISQAMSRRGAMEPLGPILDQLVSLTLAAKGEGPAMTVTSIRDAVGRALEATEMRLVKRGAVCVPSGLEKLDRAIYGFQGGFVYILGARTSIGKTTMATTMAVNAAMAGHKVAFVTVEMSDSDLADKMLTRCAKVQMNRYLAGDLAEEDIDRIAHAGGQLVDLPITFVQANKPTMEALAFEVMRLVRIQKTELVIIDYLQLFETGDGRFRNAREDVKTVSARLKALARTLNVPILVLSQLNRQAPENGEPELTHIAESDQIVRDADVVMLLYCDEKDQYWLTVAKNRRGEKVRVMLRADLPTNTFEEGRQ